MKAMKFTLTANDPGSSARAGILRTGHGDIPTPIFMPVGTAGTVKAVHTQHLRSEVNAHIILGNTYHLYLRPGTEILRESGGLHRFMGWDGPILTDSGGYQVYSLSGTRKIKAEGVDFRSHIDGSLHRFTPENVIDTQRAIGADIIMALDECTPYPCDHKYARQSLDLTHDWLQRCIKRYQETEPLYGFEQSLFPIVQGSVFDDLRKRSAEFVASLGLEGNAIGGLSVGEPEEELYRITELVCSILPADKPRYLMGVGTPVNLLQSIARGIDMFDCVMPTRNGRNGMLFTRNGIINIRNKKWEREFSLIDEHNTGILAGYSLAYLRHLFVSGEMLGPMIASLHNLRFYLQLVTEARVQIIEGSFSQWKDLMIKKLSQRL
jgi:queuine tRNA-ribosyltransferase